MCFLYKGQFFLLYLLLLTFTLLVISSEVVEQLVVILELVWASFTCLLCVNKINSVPLRQELLREWKQLLRLTLEP